MAAEILRVIKGRFHMHMIKTFMIFFLISMYVVDSHANESNSNHILSIGDDGVLSYRFMFTDVIGASFGYYFTDRERKNNIGQSYTRDYKSQIIALRININPEDVLRKYFEFDIRRSNVTYVGSTAEDYDRSERTIYFDMEYLLGDHFSVEGMFGFGTYKTTYETETESGRFGPATRLSVNYLF